MQKKNQRFSSVLIQTIRSLLMFIVHYYHHCYHPLGLSKALVGAIVFFWDVGEIFQKLMAKSFPATY